MVSHVSYDNAHTYMKGQGQAYRVELACVITQVSPAGGPSHSGIFGSKGSSASTATRKTKHGIPYQKDLKNGKQMSYYTTNYIKPPYYNHHTINVEKIR